MIRLEPRKNEKRGERFRGERARPGCGLRSAELGECKGFSIRSQRVYRQLCRVKVSSKCFSGSFASLGKAEELL